MTRAPTLKPVSLKTLRYVADKYAKGQRGHKKASIGIRHCPVCAGAAHNAASLLVRYLAQSTKPKPKRSKTR